MYLFNKKDTRIDDVISKIANINGKYYNDLISSSYGHEYHLLENERKSAFLKMFSKEHRKTTIVQGLQYTTSSVAFYGLIFCMPALLPKSNSDLESYLIILTQQICGIPGTLIAAYTCGSFIGRKGTEFFGFTISAAAVYVLIYSKDLVAVFAT